MRHTREPCNVLKEGMTQEEVNEVMWNSLPEWRKDEILAQDAKEEFDNISDEIEDF